MIDILICFSLASILSVVSVILGGSDNGAFYAKGNKAFDENNQGHWAKEYLLKGVENFHFIEYPISTIRFWTVFLYTYCLIRIPFDDMILWYHVYGIPALTSLVYSLSISWAGNYYYQMFINVGSGKLPVDPEEKKKSEVAVNLGVINFKFWRPRFYAGKTRMYVSILGILCLIICIFGLYIIGK